MSATVIYCRRCFWIFLSVLLPDPYSYIQTLLTYNHHSLNVYIYTDLNFNQFVLQSAGGGLFEV